VNRKVKNQLFATDKRRFLLQKDIKTKNKSRTNQPPIDADKKTISLICTEFYPRLSAFICVYLRLMMFFIF